MTSKRCVWQTIKKYYMGEREKAQAEGRLDPNQARPKFSANIHIVTFISPTPETSSNIQFYDSRIWTIEELLETIEKVICPCGKRYERFNLQHYLHSAGMNVRLSDGTVSKQWVFARCKNCGYEMAFWKILRELGGRPS
jgi:hypothetical protein